MTSKQRRAYQREWYRKNRKAKMQSKKVNDAPNVSTNGELISVINAYHNLYNHTNNGETRAKLNQVLSAIVVEMA